MYTMKGDICINMYQECKEEGETDTELCVWRSGVRKSESQKIRGSGITDQERLHPEGKREAVRSW